MTRINQLSVSTVHVISARRSSTSGRMRRAVSCVATLAILMTGMVVGAHGAAAASSPSALTMGLQCAQWDQSSATDVVVTGDVGDIFTATKGTMGSACFAYPYTISGASGIVTTGDSSVSGAGTVFTIVGSGTFDIVRSPMSYPQNLTITVVATAPVVTAGAGPTPEDVFQSIGLVSASSCASVTRPDLDWSGVASGNWTQSWAMWPNAGKGGPVCNRVLWFDSNSARWSTATR